MSSRESRALGSSMGGTARHQCSPLMALHSQSLSPSQQQSSRISQATPLQARKDPIAHRNCAYGELSFSSRRQHTSSSRCHGSAGDYVTVTGGRQAEFDELV